MNAGRQYVHSNTNFIITDKAVASNKLAGKKLFESKEGQNKNKK